MNKNKLYSIIRMIIDVDTISDDAKLVGDFGFSSFQLILLLFQIEKEFSVDLPICYVSNSTTVLDLLNLIEKEAKEND